MTAYNRSLIDLITAMVIFGTVGIFRKMIPYSSELIALVRGCVGTAFLLIAAAVRRKRFDRQAIQKNLPALLLSGVAIGFNWILLFEAMRYTSVAVATMCYYLSPTLVVLAAPFVLGEKLSSRQKFCAAAALLGMILVSLPPEGFGEGFRLRGVLLALGAAALYASVILINKKMTVTDPTERTTVQLGAAALALVPYELFVVPAGNTELAPVPVLLLLVMGVMHTGAAYLLYFRAVSALKARTVALLSYLDPVLAFLLSVLLLREPLSGLNLVGSLIILAAAVCSELPVKENK